MTNILKTIWLDSGFSQMSWQTAVMLILACVLLYLGIVKKYEPLLMIGIAFGMLLTNLPGANLYHPELWDRFLAGEIGYGTILHDGGLLDILYIGVKSGVYPSLIFLGVGAMTDFGPLIANPKSLLLGQFILPLKLALSGGHYALFNGGAAFSRHYRFTQNAGGW